MQTTTHTAAPAKFSQAVQAALAVKQAQQIADAALRSLRVKEVAEIFGVTPPTVWRWARRDDFPPAIRMSSRVTCWNLGELLAWRDAQKVGIRVGGK